MSGQPPRHRPPRFRRRLEPGQARPLEVGRKGAEVSGSVGSLRENDGKTSPLRTGRQDPRRSADGPHRSLRERRTSGWTPGEKCPLWQAFRPGRRLSACFCVLLIYGVRRARSSAYPAKSPGCRSSLASRLCQPLSVESWQASRGDTCLANRRLLPGILRPRVPSRLVLGLTYSQLFTFHRVLWRCAATSGARGRHASVLMLCVSGKNIKAGVLRRKKLLKKQLSKKTFIYPCSVKSVSPEERNEGRCEISYHGQVGTIAGMVSKRKVNARKRQRFSQGKERSNMSYHR